MLKNKQFWRAALIRALKTLCQTLAGTLPAGFAITPVMLRNLDVSMLYVVLAWLGTGLLSAFISILTSIMTGLPEVEDDRGVNAISDGWPVDEEKSDE